MVAIVRPEGYEKLVYMRHFSEKQTNDEQEAKQSKQLSGATANTYVFQICPTRCFNV